MNFQSNNYQQNYDELSRNVISNTGMKYSQIKGRKKGVPIEKQKLYQENYQLRNKVKELEETNLKLKTQLMVTQKEKEELFNMAEEEMFHPKIPQRSQSGSHKGSSANPIDNKTNFTLLKQKQNSAIKKLVRDKHSENEQLRFQNQNIKKTMKFTRLSQLISQNNELIQETKRLRLQIIESRNYAQQFNADYSNKIQSLKKQLQQERDTEKRNGVELKKQFQANNQLKEKLRQSQIKKVQIERRLNKQLKTLKSENLDLRSRITNQMIGKQCQKPDCARIRKQKYDLKRKVEQQQKQIKNLKDQQLIAKRQQAQREYHYKNNIEANNANHKKAEHQKRPSQPSQQKMANNSGVSQKRQTTQNHVQPSPKTNQPKLQANKQVSKEKEKIIPQPKPPLTEKSKESEVQPTLQKQSKHEAQNKPKVQQNKDNHPEKTNKKQKTLPGKKKTENVNESYDTQKLLESYQQSNENKQEVPQKASKVVNSQQQQEQYYKQSEGEYQQIDFQQENQPVKQSKQKQKSKSKKESEKKKEKDPQSPTVEQKKDKLPQKKKEDNAKQQKSKSKSNKKVSKPAEEQQVLYQKDKKEENQDDGKSQLKLIKQTLTYKFNAQGYTYDDLAKDLSQSGKKTFSVTEMMDILTEQPFLLSEEHIETIIIYLFQTDNLTGDESLPTKNFLKKIKKFIAKAKPLDKQTQEHNISELIALIQTDEAGKKKIRSQCKKHDSGNGTISKQDFVKIMQGMKVGNDLLETAVAQIVYVSTDINNLNYDFFLKRFTQAQ